MGGAITGFVFAIYYRKKAISIALENPHPDNDSEDEDEDDELSDEYPYWMEDTHQENKE